MQRRSLLALGAGLVLAAPALAQAPYPDRPITMILSYAAGGGTDAAARTLARFLERDLGQPIVVVNRPGAGGEIGWSELARAKPDGYSIGFANTPGILTVPIERPQARFRLEDFAPIANIVDDPGGVWVLADSPYRTLGDLVEAARKAPGTIGYGTTGIGSDDQLAMLALERQTGVTFLHVPFAGSSQVRTALLSRNLPVAVMNMAEGVADGRQGLIWPLAQLGPRRWEAMPEVPTARELGFEVVEGSMRGVVAPAGVPRPILDRLAGSVRRAVEDPEFQKAAQQQSLPLRFLGPDEYRAELLALRAGYEKLWAVHPWKE
ncbi:tripartite tricarboxylate transporter substrate binding protein [Roseicella aquatilis]|uniref:tripartite tricarboxylate transporter substrate binding protein n=1 Tax=Roseicella aquatilis TaxID=2527868 RepID=UPI001F0CFF4D|nr:tripartite tricarboxylate transporter substrate binding protein [Roseicella aquatilis]